MLELVDGQKSLKISLENMTVLEVGQRAEGKDKKYICRLKMEKVGKGRTPKTDVWSVEG
jgi:hypothetical protein